MHVDRLDIIGGRSLPLHSSTLYEFYLDVHLARVYVSIGQLLTTFLQLCTHNAFPSCYSALSRGGVHGDCYQRWLDNTGENAFSVAQVLHELMEWTGDMGSV